MMKRVLHFLVSGLLPLQAAAALLLASCQGAASGEAERSFNLTVDKTELSCTYEAAVLTLEVSADCEWGVSSGAPDWCTVSPSGGLSGKSEVKVSLAENYTSDERETALTFRYGSSRKTVSVVQNCNEGGSDIPAGYSLVWQDEFNTAGSSVPDSDKWWYETGDGGWGNNELQNYVAGGLCGDVKIAEVSDGTLKITAQKIGGKVQSVRMNTKSYWTYGYFEARLKLPKGRGTWPAFWMMPQNFTAWPADGEIDIMEEVGYNPEYVSSSIHCTAYNHPKNTQKTHEFKLEGSQSGFHTYALEWTPEKMDFIFDGKVHMTFKNDGKGNYDTWPFNNPFYLKLNLAWGGNWGGAKGVDESCLPATYEIDYVRVYQKK